MGEIGRIETGAELGRHVEVIDDHDGSGGFLILTYGIRDRSGDAFDSWVETIVDVELFFDEAGWTVRWSDS